MKKIERFYEMLKDPGAFFALDFVKTAASTLTSQSHILDAGAGQCTYKKYFSHCNYMAIDSAVGDETWDYSQLDLVAPLDKIPVEHNRFDAILCTSVLEHLPDPLACLKEFRRVLKPDGTLFLTAPFFHHEHQTPYDYFRFTSYGLKHLLNLAGFDEKTLVLCSTGGGIFMRWAYELTSLFDIFPTLRIGKKTKLKKDFLLLPIKILFLLYIRALQIFLITLDSFDKSKKSVFGWNVIVKKT